MDEITLRPLLHSDIEKVRCWRNNSENTKFLRKIGYIDVKSQEEWYNSYLCEEDVFTFAIVDNKVAKGIVGTVSIYGIEGKKAEVGKILIGDSRAHNRKIGRKAMVLAMMVGFSNLGVKTFHAFVEPDNIAAYKTYMAIGFKIEEIHVTNEGKRECGILINEEAINNAGYTKDDVYLFNYNEVS